MLNSLGISARESETGVFIYGKENLLNFLKSVGFVDGTKVQKGLWKGCQKSDVFKEMVSSYRLVPIRAKRS